MSDSTHWTCPACNTAVGTAFCPGCGEGQPHPHELTLRGLLHQAVAAFTSLDARLWRSLRTLVRRPGALTVLYQHGPRKPYIGPFALFLLANVLFVAMEVLPGSNIFSTPLENHLHRQPWSPLAQVLVSNQLQESGMTQEAYAPVFNQAVARNAQSLIILMVLPFALFSPVLFRKSQVPFAVHAVFSLHFHAFLLLLMSVALLLPIFNLWLGGPGLASQPLDNGVAIATLSICAVYLYLSAGRVFGGNGTIRLLKSVLLVCAATGVFLGYRFLLFLITLYST